MIEKLSPEYPIRELCAVLEVSRSGYYAWQKGQKSARELANRLMADRSRHCSRPSASGMGARG